MVLHCLYMFYTGYTILYMFVSVYKFVQRFAASIHIYMCVYIYIYIYIFFLCGVPGPSNIFTGLRSMRQRNQPVHMYI